MLERGRRQPAIVQQYSSTHNNHLYCRQEPSSSALSQCWRCTVSHVPETDAAAAAALSNATRRLPQRPRQVIGPTTDVKTRLVPPPPRDAPWIPSTRCVFGSCSKVKHTDYFIGSTDNRQVWLLKEAIAIARIRGRFLLLSLIHI